MQQRICDQFSLQISFIGLAPDENPLSLTIWYEEKRSKGMKLIQPFSLYQWFPTGVPRHTKVPWAGDRCAANQFLDL